MWLWNLVHENLGVIVPLLVPIGFNLVNSILKWERGVLNPDLLGADMSVGSCSLYAGTVLGGIYHRKFTSSDDILTALIVAFILLGSWWLCLSLGTRNFPVGKGSDAQPRMAFVIGCGFLYISCVLAWKILQGAPK